LSLCTDVRKSFVRLWVQPSSIASASLPHYHFHIADFHSLTPL